MVDTFFLKMSWPNWLFLLGVFALAGISWFYYRRTLPPLNRSRQSLATVLRALSIVILLFLVLQPVLEMIYRQLEKPVVAVLIDDSASMTIKDPDGSRADSLLYLLGNLSSSIDPDSIDTELFAFSDHIRPVGDDTMRFQSDATDLDLAIRAVQDSLSGRNLQKVILVSDGIYTRGVNPLQSAERSSVPIHTVRIGESQAPTDLAVRRVQHNAITYAGQETPVKVTLWQNGMEGQQAIVKLRLGKNVVNQRRITLGPSGFEQNLDLSLKSGREGNFRYQVEITPLSDELNTANNSKSFRLQVLKRQVNVLVLSGVPNFDRHFLSVTADFLPDFNFTFLTQKNGADFYESSLQKVNLDSQDVIILHGFPTSNTGQPAMVSLTNVISEKSLPVLWLLNRHTRLDKLKSVADKLPFTQLSPLRASGDHLVQLTLNGKLHPAIRINENETANTLLWKDLPLIETFAPLKIADGSQVLITSADAENKQAVVFAWRKGQQKHLIFNGANFGNWYFQLQEDPRRQDFFATFMERTLRWLKNRDDIQQIQIRPLQDSYNVGEAITFSGQVYDAFYQPVPDAQVRVVIWQDSTQFANDEMQAEGDGFYRSDISGLAEGEYRYRVSAVRGEKQLGSRSGQLSVQPFFQEFQTIAANHQLLNEISQRSGGISTSVKEFVEAPRLADLSKRTSFSNSEIFLWDHWEWLMLLVILLGSEWFLRKKWGML